MRRFATFIAALTLALLCAGGFAASETAATLPPYRHILNISFSAQPAELVVPGEVALTFNITNASSYNAENVYISAADGLHTEPLGQIAAGDSKIFNRTHAVTEDELEAGQITYIISHDGIAGDRDTVNYTVQCPIERAIARPAAEFTRQFTGTYARPGDVVTITYRVRNTGNVPLASLRVYDALGEYTGRADALEEGESCLFTSKVTITGAAVSAPQLVYAVPAEDDREYTVELDEARILVADEQLTATLELDRETARSGETVTATLTIMSLGNVDFYDISVTDETRGGLIADALEMPAGGQPLVITREYPVRGDAEFQFLVRALSPSGVTIEALTETVPLRALGAGRDAEISVYAEAVYGRVASAGNVPVDIYILNSGDSDAREADLTETTTGTALRSFAFLAGGFTTHRRVYVPVTESTELVFSVRYLDDGGARRTAVSQPVSVEIGRGGRHLENVDANAPYSGVSFKLSEGSTFWFVIIGAAAVLMGLTVALLLSSRRQKRVRREKMALQKRLRQEELGKTNRFTPVKREKKKKDGTS